jgi:hypothetical protein
MGWVEDREEQMRPAPRVDYCITCGREHEARPFLRDVTPAHRARYLQGTPRFPVPPVPTSGWDMDAWCRWIDGHGEWGEPLGNERDPRADPVKGDVLRLLGKCLAVEEVGPSRTMQGESSVIYKIDGRLFDARSLTRWRETTSRAEVVSRA